MPHLEAERDDINLDGCRGINSGGLSPKAVNIVNIVNIVITFITFTTSGFKGSMESISMEEVCVGNYDSFRIYITEGHAKKHNMYGVARRPS